MILSEARSTIKVVEIANESTNYLKTIKKMQEIKLLLAGGSNQNHSVLRVIYPPAPPWRI